MINVLSILVGGVIGCANLRVWRVIVAALTAGGKASGKAAVARLAGCFFLKLGLLGGLVALVVWSGLAPLGVIVGFGGVLLGACVMGLRRT